MGNINAVTDLKIENEVAVISVNSPPVNAMSAQVRGGLFEAFPVALSDANARGIVVICEGRTFFAGADISELGKPDPGPSFAQVLAAIENADKPVVAAMHGTALGGGFELALACHYRVAVPSAKVGLPEVKLGVLPGAGGTQRLPRIVGIEYALDLITSGRTIAAIEAHGLGAVDELLEEGSLRSGAIEFVRRVLAEKRPLKRVRDLTDKIDAVRNRPEIFTEFSRANARRFRGFKAPQAIVRCIEAAATLPFEEGLKLETDLFQELVAGPESEAQRYVFFAERETSKIPDIDSKLPTLPITRVAVIGAGTMGSGIAATFLNADMPVTLLEQNQNALERGLASIRLNYENTVRHGKLTQQEVARRLGRLQTSLDLGSVASCELIVEAVFEDLELKKSVMRRLDGLAKDDAILATNTSFLDLEMIAARTSRPERVLGLHFFSPANVMRLLEVVRGAKTSKTTIATAMQLARRIGKIAVLSRACPGFIANRMMRARTVVASQLLLEGQLPWEIDRVATDFGFPMGPFAMADLVGLDVMESDPTAPGNPVQRALKGMGRLGQKAGGGYYDYGADRKASPSRIAEETIRGIAARERIEPRRYTDSQLLERLLYPIVNEGAKILEEGVAIRSSDIDIALVYGYGWPAYRGGPMFWASKIGLSRVLEQLRTFEAEGGSFDRPCALLEKLAAERKGF